MNVKHGAGAAREPQSPSGRGLGRWSLLTALALFFGASVAVVAAPLPATGSVEALFTPWDDAEGAIVRALGKAKQSVHVQAYLLTSRAIAAALLDAKSRGVAVEVLTDREMAAKGENSLIPKLLAGGIPVWLETRYAAAHNKIILIDVPGEHGIVITGSYNFTWSAQARNAENLLLLRDNPALARRYLDNWQRHRDEAEAMSGSN